MTVTPTKESTPATSPDQVEVLIKEARRRGRRHRLVVGLLVTAVLAATAIAAIVIGIGGRNLVPDRSRARHPSNHLVSAAAWATARRTCDGRPLRAARSDGATPHLYGAYPTTVRLAINWPNRIYPLAGPPTPTTVINGRQPNAHFDPWGGYNSSRSALICIFTGDFRLKVPSMQGIFIERAKVLAMYQFSTWPIPSAISVTPMNSVPSRPVPLA
jgi:hypothetical protein